MKIIAFYLPQFHAFPENDEWWGRGFTEWTNTRKAKPLYRGHYEPRVPLHKNYYNLLNPETFRWQIDLAKKYGVYGFCFDHSWFSGKILMQKPMENFLADPTLDQHFCICWANETWSRRWDGLEHEILISQEHGDETEWRAHFDYLLPFFRDSRYIQVDGKPLFVLYKPEIFPEYPGMFRLWDALAKESGLRGMTFAVQSAIWNTDPQDDEAMVDCKIMFEPGYTGLRKDRSLFFRAEWFALRAYAKVAPWFRAKPISYPGFCREILRRPVGSEKEIPGMFVDWDNTPRKGERGSTTLFHSPERFQACLTALIRKTREEYHKDILFLNAWNEWAEGCYLEPDEKYGYACLEAVKSALIETNEFPEEG